MPYILLLAAAVVSLVTIVQTAQLNTTVDRLTTTATTEDTSLKTAEEPVKSAAPTETASEPTSAVSDSSPAPLEPRTGEPQPVSEPTNKVTAPVPERVVEPPAPIREEVKPAVPSAPEEPSSVQELRTGEQVEKPRVPEAERTPKAEFVSPHAGKIRGTATLELEVENALSVEFYSRRPGAPEPRLLGVGERKNERRWTFSWDTKTFPNDHYQLYARISNEFGQYESGPRPVFIINEIAIVPQEKEIIAQKQNEREEQEKKIEKEKEGRKVETVETIEREIMNFSEQMKAQATPQEVKKIEQVVKEVVPEIKKEVEEKLKRFDENTATLKQEEVKRKEVEAFPVIEAERERVEKVRKEIEEKIKAEREKKEEVRREIIKRIEEAKEKIVETLPEQKREQAEPAKAEAVKKMEAVMGEFEAKVEREEEQKAAQVPAIAFKDSDEDGISDYEETFRFNTNPFVADSDEDGFKDGVEMASGYNPLDASPSDVVAYESPKEAGITQPQRLKVESVEVVEKREVAPGVEVVAKIQIKGKTLPNSWITVYIFSLPIIVTVKSDAEGVWTYTLDKELEDGDHEVYVATTDNTGKIAAKSEPLPFVKQASAVIIGTGVTPPFSVPSPQDTTFLSRTYLILALTFIAFALGVALLVIGFISMKREKEQRERQEKK